MATLADSFLADLDDLSDDEGGQVQEQGGEEEGDLDDDEMADIEALNYDDLDSVAKLHRSQKFLQITEKVNAALAAENSRQQETTAASGDQSEARQDSASGSTPSDAPNLDYQLIVDCNALTADIENEVAVVYNFIRDKYNLKFPELESLVSHPIDYARVVKRIGNEMDLTLVDLEGLLPSATIMVVSVTASTTTGKPLAEESLEKVIEACDRALFLDETKKKILAFVESRMGLIAPNLSAIVGSAIAAQLMGVAGGLAPLAASPACNVQVFGAKRKNLAGYSTATALSHTGFIFHSEIVQSTPPALRLKACRLVAGKCTLAARVDATGGDASGKMGRGLKEEIAKKIEKWQEPPPAKQPKPLPVPDMEPKKRRGGRRLRRMKERYAVTDMRKLANRMQFGVVEESTLGDGLGEGYGMLGQAGSGKLRVSVTSSKLAAKAGKKFKEKSYGSSGNTSGLSSSLAFTPVQGIELSNPQANVSHLGSGTQSTYFSEVGTFSRVKKS